MTTGHPRLIGAVCVRNRVAMAAVKQQRPKTIVKNEAVAIIVLASSVNATIIYSTSNSRLDTTSATPRSSGAGSSGRSSGRLSGRRRPPAAEQPGDGDGQPAPRRRRTPGQQFAITVDLDMARALRSRIRSEFVAIFLGVLEYACARERSETAQVPEGLYDELGYEAQTYLLDTRRRLLARGYDPNRNGLPPQPQAPHLGTPADLATRQERMVPVVRECAGETARAEGTAMPRYHLHCYLKFLRPVYLDEVRARVAAWADGLRYDVQFCQCRDKWLAYIWKEDATAYTNVRLSQRGFLQKAWHWANRTREFSQGDAFVTYYRQNARFLQGYHACRRGERLARAFPGLRPVTAYYPPADSWTGECARWWNRWHATFRPRRPCLYLWGPPNVGKTTWVTHLIGGTRMMPYVYLPGVGEFLMTSFAALTHRVILFEEFDESKHNGSMLRRLMEGAPYAYPVKYEALLRLEFKGPIILISNRSDAQLSEGLRSRVHAVHAAHPYWEYLNDDNGMIALPPAVAAPIADAAEPRAAAAAAADRSAEPVELPPATAEAVVAAEVDRPWRIPSPPSLADLVAEVAVPQNGGAMDSDRDDLYYDRGDYDSDEWERMNVDSDGFYGACVRRRVIERGRRLGSEAGGSRPHERWDDAGPSTG